MSASEARRRAPTRRTVLAGLSGLSVPAALADVVQRFSSISVDVGPLRARGLGPYAEVVRATLQAELASAFADRMTRQGPRLVVRVTGLSMCAYVGGETSRWGLSAGVSNDYLEGEALIVGRRGEVLRRHPQLSALPASSGGAWYLPDSESRRLVAISRHYAAWLRDGLG